MTDYIPKSVWNMDEARLQALNYYLRLVEDAFEYGNHELIHKHLRSVRRILFGKLKEEEMLEVNEIFSKMQEYKDKFYTGGTKEIKFEMYNEFYNQADEAYIKMNKLMKKHGLYFREGDDPRRAVLRR